MVIGLIAAGCGLVVLTSARTPPGHTTITDSPRITLPEPGLSPFRLLLSNRAAEVVLDSGNGSPVRFEDTQSSLSGHLALDPANPHVSVIVRWADSPAEGEHRFARLTIEPPGQPTFTHVFDSAGDIDDFQELPVLPLP